MKSAAKAESVSREKDSGDAETEGRSQETHPQRQLGRYTLVKKLGFGAFGEVWLAQDSQLNRPAAIKLPRFATNDVKRSRRFISEAKAAAALRHPNIVPIFDAGVIGEQLYIATEFIRGMPLSEVNQGRPAPIKWAVEIIAKLADAIHYAHTQGIVHRDIKPDNVLVDRQGEPQLLDFGLAKRLDDTAGHTIDGTVLGTPTYMSPEQARGDIANVGPASDQFSLGVALYRLIAGRTPFVGPPIAVLHQILNDSPPPLTQFAPEVPIDLNAICEKARAEFPQDRYPTCEAFAEDLRNYLDGKAVAAQPLTPVMRSIRWSRKHPRESLLGAICSALGTIALIASTTGWIAATRNAIAAAESERLVRAETMRLQSLEQAVQTRVDEATKTRDAALAAKNAEAASRLALEAETTKLNAATAAAVAATQQVTKSTSAYNEQEANNSTLSDSLSSTVEKLKSSATKTIDLPIAEPVEQQAVLVHDRGSGFVCLWEGREMILRDDGTERSVITAKLPSPIDFADVSLTADGRMYAGWRRISSSVNALEASVGTFNSYGSLDPLLKFQINTALLSKLEVPENGRNMVQFDGRFAVDDAGDVFISLSDSLVKFKSSEGEFEILKKDLGRGVIVDVDFYSAFDPEGLYLTTREGIYRCDLADLAGQPLKNVFRMGDRHGRLLSSEFVSKTTLIISTSKSGTQLLDASAKVYRSFRENLNVFAVTAKGELIASKGFKELVISKNPLKK